MSTLTDYLIKIQDLTQQNLEILKTINDSFFSNKTYLKTTISGVDYAMPSFLSLENKINALQENFENLVNAPKTGEAFFNFDGSSRAIEVRNYSAAPNSLELKTLDKFSVKTNNIFKDFLTPVPYINFDLSKIPNDITSVNVKKIIPRSTSLIEQFKKIIEDNCSTKRSWGDMYKTLSIFEKDIDYVEYDTIMKLPVRSSGGTGSYVIEKIVSDTIDKNLDEYLEIKIRNNIASKNFFNSLSYKTFDETIEKLLKVGDQLLTYDDSAKMEITEVRYNTNTLVVKVLNGEYLNLTTNDSEVDVEKIPDGAKLKFYAPVDFDNDKYIQVPLEEDQYIFVAISPLNDRMNVQAPWGTGLVINTYLLKNGDINFENYYNANVRNIGDILNDITSMFSTPLSNLNQSDFDKLTAFIPILEEKDLDVVQINDHLNTNDTIKNIRTLYSQKISLKTQLSEVQSNITKINDELSRLSFDDTTNMRSIYQNQLVEYNKTKNELNTSINKVIDEISLNVNNAEVPIENAKYRIRGFYNIPDEHKQNIRKIVVQYRYKNANNASGNATTINSNLFTDWNIMDGVINNKLVTRNNGVYSFDFEGTNENKDMPSYNQIDIPISQGETVDIRVKIVYDYGWPFVELSSSWSDILNISFPTEYLKDVQILDIISENNSDIETNRFSNIIKDAGITSHVDDNIIDQDITYFHNPSHIASGFYTNERRVIPLKDKLEDLTNIITQLQDEVYGSSSEQVDVYLSIGDISHKLTPFQDNNFYPKSYEAVTSSQTSGSIAGYVVNKDDNSSITANIGLIIKNNSTHSVKLFPMFPGPDNKRISDVQSKFNNEDYDKGGEGPAIYMKYRTADDKGKKSGVQVANQMVSFRINNPYTTDEDYGYTELPALKSGDEGAVLYPYIPKSNSLCELSNIGTISYRLLNPGESITIPLEGIYRFKKESSTTDQAKCTMSVDIRTSLYSDPLNYTYNVIFNRVTKTENEVYSHNVLNEYNVVI